MRQGIANAAAVVLLANVLFCALVVATPGEPAVVADRIRAAFHAGDLDSVDYLPANARRGWHQYNDCIILQMIANSGQSPLARGLAPTTFHVPEHTVSCRLLRALMLEGADRDTLPSFRYARYWHGYMVPTAAALRVVDLRELRLVLSAAVWLALAALAVAGLRAGRRVKLTTLAIILAAGVLWALPYFAPSLSHGPGDAALLLGLAVLAARPALAATPRTLLPYAAGFGASVVFFEMLTGQLPTAAAWLGALTFAARLDMGERGGEDAPGAVAGALGAFAIGGMTTVLAKQVLALLLVEPAAGAVFASKLGEYMRLPDSAEPMPSLLLSFVKLARAADILTYWQRWAGTALAGAIVLVWLAAVARGWRHRRTPVGREVLVLAGLALVPAFWVLLLPGHSQQHSGFMVRMLVVPISLAPLALLWPGAPRPTSPGSSHRTRSGA